MSHCKIKKDRNDAPFHRQSLPHTSTSYPSTKYSKITYKKILECKVLNENMKSPPLQYNRMVPSSE